MELVACVVIGAGVVGLAVARAVAMAGREVVVLEAAEAIGTGTSSRNSEVLHAGLYHAPGSLKADLCVRGRRALVAFCASHAVAVHPVGKLVVATVPAELPLLEGLAARGRDNGVEGLRWLTGAEARAMEPALRAEAALFSAATSIIDSHGLMLALLAEAQAHRATLVLRAPVVAMEAGADGIDVILGEAVRVRARVVVNAAGLGAIALAQRTRGLASGLVPRAAYAKGSYFALRGPSPFRHLVYPVPVPGGAGIHLTLDRAGAARFGPDVEVVAAPDYAVDPARAPVFVAAIRRYWPDLPDGALVAAYAGVRPKLGEATGAGDFMVQGPATHGIAGLVNLFGIESPGLTACLALAHMTAEAALTA